MKNMSIPAIGMIALLLFVSSACNTSSVKGNEKSDSLAYQVVKVGEFEKLMADPSNVLIDFRTPEEVAEGKIRTDAQAIDYLDDAVFQAGIAQLDKNKTYLVYCRSGRRSGEASQIMVQQGFKKVYNLDGGITAWNAEHNK